MKLKTFTLLLVYIFCGSFMLFSQNNNNPNENKSDNNNKRETTFVEGHLNKLKTDVELTNEQEKEIIKLLEQFYKDRTQAEAKKAERKQMLNDKKSSYETYITALYSILTTEQCIQHVRKAEERIQAGRQIIRELSTNN